MISQLKFSHLKPSTVCMIFFISSLSLAFAGAKPDKVIEDEKNSVILRAKSIKDSIVSIEGIVGQQPTVDKSKIMPSIKTLNKRIKALAKSSYANEFGSDLVLSLEHRYPEKTTYFNANSAECQCIKFKGWNCNECGCGNEGSWANHCASACCCGGKADDVKCLEFTFMLPVTGFVTFFQLVLEPFQPSKWDTSKAKCSCPSVGCPLTDVIDGDDLRAHLKTVSSQLTTFITYLETGMVPHYQSQGEGTCYYPPSAPEPQKM